MGGIRLFFWVVCSTMRTASFKNLFKVFCEAVCHLKKDHDLYDLDDFSETQSIQ